MPAIAFFKQAHHTVERATAVTTGRVVDWLPVTPTLYRLAGSLEGGQKAAGETQLYRTSEGA